MTSNQPFNLISPLLLALQCDLSHADTAVRAEALRITPLLSYVQYSTTIDDDPNLLYSLYEPDPSLDFTVVLSPYWLRFDPSFPPSRAPSTSHQSCDTLQHFVLAREIHPLTSSSVSSLTIPLALSARNYSPPVPPSPIIIETITVLLAHSIRLTKRLTS